MATLASPLAFELCDGTCGDPKPSKDSKHVHCPSSDTCGKGGCYCQLFKRKKNSKDEVPWEVAHADHEGKVKYRPGDLDYKCFCAKPILEAGQVTIGEEKYVTNFQLCGQGSCDISNVPVFDEDGKHQEVKCGGKCEGECKCTLFRLQVSAPKGAAFKPEDAKWELAAKADKQVKHDAHFIYHCFCLK